MRVRSQILGQLPQGWQAALFKDERGEVWVLATKADEAPRECRAIELPKPFEDWRVIKPHSGPPQKFADSRLVYPE